MNHVTLKSGADKLKSTMNKEPNQIEETNITFNGNILNSLAEHLPNNIIALQELIKNAYDASADNVSIKLNSKDRTLIVEDDGNGMDIDGLKRLFNIGRHNKDYGKQFNSNRSNERRYYQGSKGLGFLSAMHFGDEVEWQSSIDGKEANTLKCKLSELLEMQDLQEAKLHIFKSASIRRGTTITVKLDDYHLRSLVESFGDTHQVSKICNTFRDSKINIRITRDGKTCAAEKLTDYGKGREYDIFYVKIIPTTREVKMYYHDSHVDTFSIPYEGEKFKLEGEILILNLTGKKGKDITNLFWNANKSLSPLIYVNNSLFDDWTLFDPEIRRKYRSTESFAQMIGYLDIICSDSELQFNPDRTRFHQNELSDTIRNTLLDVNNLIQQKAADFKEKIEQSGAKLERGFEIPDIPVEKAFIRVCANRTYKVPSPQIDLRKDILLEVKNSQGVDVSFDALQISIDGVISTTGILESQASAGQVIVRYSFEDELTGLAAREIELIFSEAKSTPKVVKNLNLLEFSPEYTKERHLKLCSKLIGELNALSASSITKYKEVIACSLRTIYELSVAALKNNSMAPKSLQKPSKTESAIIPILNYIVEHKDDFAPKSKVISYDSLKNIDVKEYRRNYKTSNLGAHVSSNLLTTEKIRDIAQTASIFSALVSELLTYDKK